jgi:hypothetical protein
MPQPVECIRCRAQMEAGYVVDTRAGSKQQNWSPGEPISSAWTGLKGKADSVPVTTFRCPKCGYLESFAIRPTSSER